MYSGYIFPLQLQNFDSTMLFLTLMNKVYRGQGLKETDPKNKNKTKEVLITQHKTPLGKKKKSVRI